VNLANIDQVYDISEESNARTPRRLHRLTTHSLRHYAITSFSKQTNGNLVLTSRFARHADPSTTMIYISTKKEELYKELDNMAMDSVERLKRSVINMER
jgi:integrase